MPTLSIIQHVWSSLLTLVLMLIVAGVLLAAGAVGLMAWALLHPPRMTDGKAAWVLKRLSPGDLGLPFEEVQFTIRAERTREPLKIAGWWIPHPHARGRCAVLVHGYADAKVGAIAWAPMWHAVGFNIFALDLRAHGESGGSLSTGGFFERHDVSDVLTQLRDTRPDGARELVLFGVSLGAAVALAVAAERRDVGAVVLESPFADYRSATMAHMDLLGLPGRTLQRLAIRLAERASGAEFGSVRPVDLLAQAQCPVMVIAPDEDLLLLPGEQDQLQQAIKDRENPGDVYWRVAGSAHLMALTADAAAYGERLQQFIEAAFPSSPAPLPFAPAAPG